MDTPEDVPIPGTGGAGTGGASSGTGGAATGGASGGTGGRAAGGTTSGSGGTSSRGGATGSGGSNAFDVGPDGPTDLRTDTVEAGPLLSGLVAYYPCEGATGTTLTDMSGLGHHGTLSTGATPDGGGAGTAGYSFVPGKIGNALALAKAGYGYVSLPASVFANATDITIASWVNVTTSQNWQRVFDVGVNAKIATNTQTGTLYMNLVPKNDSTSLLFSITTNGYANEQKLPATALPVGTWKHVAVVLAAGTSTLYIDGAPATSNPSNAVTLRPKDLGAIDYAYIGKSQFSADPFFDGQIDEFRVYNRALSADEILALFQFKGP